VAGKYARGRYTLEALEVKYLLGHLKGLNPFLLMKRKLFAPDGRVGKLRILDHCRRKPGGLIYTRLRWWNLRKTSTFRSMDAICRHVEGNADWWVAVERCLKGSAYAVV